MAGLPRDRVVHGASPAAYEGRKASAAYEGRKASARQNADAGHGGARLCTVGWPGIRVVDPRKGPGRPKGFLDQHAHLAAA